MDRIKAATAGEEEGDAGGAESDLEDEGAAAGGAAGHDAVADRLRQEALEGLGHLQRRLAGQLRLAPLPRAADYVRGTAAPGARFVRGHRLPVTAVVLSPDDATLWSVSKDGGIQRVDVETGARSQLLRTSDESAGAAAGAGTTADWVRSGPRRCSTSALLAAAVSSDGRYLATGGGDRRVHIWDARSSSHVRSFPGHKDAVTGLAFREGTQQLYSSSLDRCVGRQAGAEGLLSALPQGSRRWQCTGGTAASPAAPASP